MGGETKVTGPDLSVGVDASSLKVGQSVVGHVGEESVLLARVADGFCAIASTCSHYGGPLGEGVIEGDVVRCPWHHARFSLKTGDALAAPALSPVACWKVEEYDGRVKVTSRTEHDPLVRSYPFTASAKPEHVVIIGAGAAGSAAAEMLRRCAFDGSITMIEPDADAPYDRPNLSKDYLAGNAPEEWIPLRPAGFFETHRIDVVHARATRIDVAARSIELAGHDPIRYDALLIATGAEPIVLQIPGADLPHVHRLRSLSDSRAIIAASKSAKRVVVIGASFIGLEVAASLRTRNLEVHVVAPETTPLERIMGHDLGAFIQSYHSEKGVQFHPGRKPQQIDSAGVVLDDGTRLEADLVVMGVGVKPRLALAEEAGLEMDRGVVVDRYLRTSAANVYAAGDIARYPDARTGDRIRVEHWVVAQRMGQYAARNILGAEEAFTEVPFFWSAHYDTTIAYVGHAEKWDALQVDGSAMDRDVSVKFVSGSRLLAEATINRDQEALRAELDLGRGNGTP